MFRNFICCQHCAVFGIRLVSGTLGQDVGIGFGCRKQEVVSKMQGYSAEGNCADLEGTLLDFPIPSTCVILKVGTNLSSTYQ